MRKFYARISPRRQRGGDSSAFRSPLSVLFLRVLVVGVLVLAARPLAFASGEERTTFGEDLEIRTDTRWAGGALGGYLPVRVEITNHAPARTVQLEVTPADFTRGATVKRAAAVNQEATVRFTLSIPLTAFRQGTFRAYDQRGELKSHERLIGGAASLDVEAAPAMLVVSSRPVNCAGYIRAAGSSPEGLRFRNLPFPEASTLVEVVPPDSLPDSWIDYSGLDFVAISRDDLAALVASSRSAILKWVACGGNLIVHQAGKTPKDVAMLDRLLDMPGHAAVGASWTESDWRKAPAPFATRQLMLGLVCAFPDQLPDAPVDWSGFLRSVGEPRFSWMQRHGVVPDVGTAEFFNFMNPGIRGVPVYGFMVLITAFAVLIGPVNYFYLKRKRLLWLLLVTVPATALVTSVLLVGYSMAAHGFGIRSRIRSLTVLDQKSQQAVTVARLSLFAGIAPSRGMQFSPETAVYPVFPPTAEPGAFTVDWTETQALTSGWLLSRTRTQFLTIRHADEPKRVEIKPGQAGGLVIVNGLPWELEAVVVADESGRLSSARNVLPNASEPLAAASEKNLLEFVGLLGRNRPELPDNFSTPIFNPLSRRRPRRVFNVMDRFGGKDMGAHFDSNLMERLIQTWSRDLTAKTTSLSPRSYLAVLRRNPGVETGVGPTTEQAGYHLLLGYY
ncbi:MAG TPA: hypothetical protein VHX68_15740 [Planctomycetaceae bacterium]|nr:hypothetical protein [Planctomycetaceae bacterium]